MKHYKKRTIALCLASVLTVVGAFGAENYKNSLMSLRINSGSDGYVSVTAFTEKPIGQKVIKTFVDANTYVLRFPETNNATIAPIVTGYSNISDIKIDTFPYTTEKKGYTQVTIRTIGSPKISANTKTFLPTNGETTSSSPTKNDFTSTPINTTNSYNNDNTEKEQPQKQFVPPDYNKTSFEINPTQIGIGFLWITVILILIGVIFNISKDKMDSVIGGGHSDFDLDEDKPKNNKNAQIKKKTSVKRDISSIKTQLPSYNNIQTAPSNQQSFELNDKKQEKEEEEEANIILDLDSLYKEVNQPAVENPHEEPIKQEQENEEDDLAEFLNEFTFEEELSEEPKKEKELFDENLYNEVMNDSNLNFSINDITKMNQLMQVEITEDTVADLKKFLQSIKDKPRPLTKTQILEDIITTYSIKQNITFTHDDIEVIKKLMDVELDESFISDLRTNKGRVKTVQKEIEKKKVTHKVSDVITMNVKDLLPDLSKELEKQGNKKIESEVKPQVVYFSEGYDVSKFVVDLDLAKELEAKTSNDFKPSYSAPIVESGYEYTTLSIGDALPDLADVKANPKKYEEKKVEKEKADENTLLKSISNVTFKPFYEETEEEPDLFEEENIEPEIPTIDIPKTSIRPVTKNDDNAQKLLELIEKQQHQRELKEKQKLEENNKFKKELEVVSIRKEQQKPQNLSEQIKPKSNGSFENFGDEIIKTVSCDSNFSCCLVKTNNGYDVYGINGDKQSNLKHYDTLKSTNLQVRINEKLSSGVMQYLIKIGMQKFVVNVMNESMEFVMDLC